MTKDPFQALVDEITLIRGEVATLQRTSLSKDEAKILNQEVAKGLTQMTRTSAAVQQAIEGKLTTAVADIRDGAIRAAHTAAGEAIETTRAEVLVAANSLSVAAGEARREAWRYFGGFWVWLTAMLALGGLVGALASFWITGHADANAFGKFPGIYCAGAGGQTVKASGGGTFCAIWINPPPKVGN